MFQHSGIGHATVVAIAVGLGLGATRVALGQDLQVTGFSPQHGPPGTLVKIIGDQFRNVGSVTFNGADASTFWIATTTHLKAVVPENATTGPIRVSGDAGEAESAAPFVVERPAAGLLPSLSRSRPNPTRASTVLHFTLTAPSRVRLTIFDPTGRRMRVLLDGHLSVGAHEREWDGRDEIGRRVAPGLYLLVLEAQGRHLTGRLAVLR